MYLWYALRECGFQRRLGNYVTAAVIWKGSDTMRLKGAVRSGVHTTVTDTETLTAAAAAAPQLLEAAACMITLIGPVHSRKYEMQQH